MSVRRLATMTIFSLPCLAAIELAVLVIIADMIGEKKSNCQEKEVYGEEYHSPE
jgi:hypothetical protein